METAMPPRDEQDYEQRRQQIIDGALTAFSTKGFAGASNKVIAAAAQIGSPALIYHYFKDKIDLLYQVILTRMPLIELLDTTSNRLDLDPPIEELLPELLDNLIRILQADSTVALIKVVLMEALHNRQVAQMVNEVGPGRGMKILADYLERQMDAGKLRRVDPQIAVRLLVGPILAYAVTRFFFEQPEAVKIDPAELTQQMVTHFLQGMQAI